MLPIDAADDAMYNKIKGLLQTQQATLCRFLYQEGSTLVTHLYLNKLLY